MRLKTKNEESTLDPGKKKNSSFFKIKNAVLGDDDSIKIESFETLPIGIPTVDAILGGGLILGGIVEIVGLEASGKSTVAGMIAASAQSRGMPVIYLDTEAATSQARLKMLGVDIENMIYYQPNCLEEVYQTVNRVIISKIKDRAWEGPAVIVWDSLAQTPAKREVESDDFDPSKEMAIRARTNSVGLRKLTIPVQNAQILFCIINQYRENVGQSFGDKYTSPGGHAPKYAAIQRIRLSNIQNVDIDAKEKIVGKKIQFKTLKNKIHQPLLETTAILNHNTGMFDIPQSVFEVLKEKKRIYSSGPIWVVNTNKDITNEDGIIKFKRSDFATVYEQNKAAIDDVLR
jgi:protein RecA